ncbi:MAG: WYL domain-containing protein [Anaerolineae bacterium]|nr:WYL domain-containing protein [Anaerolineae bacterium]
MRADRLLSLLMLLQSRGRLTAAQLARELEVSERTVYRDIDALSAAGVPVYGDRGPDGGYALLDSYRTDLTGLTDGETRALLLLTIPSALGDLGLDDDMAQALRKLAAALPASRRGEEERVLNRFYLDPNDWRERGAGPAHLGALQRAVWEDLLVDIAYHLPSGPLVNQRIAPYGLVAWAGEWRVLTLVEGRVLAYAVSELAEAQLTGEHFARPARFDLRGAWAAWRAGRDARPRYAMTLRVDGWLAARLARYGIETDAGGQTAESDGRVTVRGSCDSFDDARARVLALGGAVEVLEPEPLRRSVIDYAEQIARRYGAPR